MEDGIARLPFSQAEHDMNKAAREIPSCFTDRVLNDWMTVWDNLSHEHSIRCCDLHPALAVHVHGCGHCSRLLHECLGLKNQQDWFVYSSVHKITCQRQLVVLPVAIVWLSNLFRLRAPQAVDKIISKKRLWEGSLSPVYLISTAGSTLNASLIFPSWGESTVNRSSELSHIWQMPQKSEWLAQPAVAQGPARHTHHANWLHFLRSELTHKSGLEQYCSRPHPPGSRLGLFGEGSHWGVTLNGCLLHPRFFGTGNSVVRVPDLLLKSTSSRFSIKTTEGHIVCITFVFVFLLLENCFHTENTLPQKTLQPRSVLEIMSNGFYSGELGPSTIAAWWKWCLANWQLAWPGSRGRFWITDGWSWEVHHVQ